MKRTILFSLIIGFTTFIITSCDNENKTQAIPPVTIKKGTADAKSTVLAEKVMEAMGGQQKWDDMHYVSWTFFGVRRLLWDKIGGRVRIENPKDTSVYLIDLNTKEGRYMKAGKEVTDAEELAKKMKQANGIWINDSYWLVMPFKLRDEGVNLKYMGEDTLKGGQASSVLELTFDGVGNTPENKYEVFVDASDNLIKQWNFYSKADQEEPSRSWPWDNYTSHNGLLISSDRSDKSGPSKVKIYENVESTAFTELEGYTIE